MKKKSSDFYLKKLIIQSYPFLNNGESFDDSNEKIFLHYIGAREAFILKEEWTLNHELMFYYTLEQSEKFKELITWHFKYKLMTKLSSKINFQDIPTKNPKEMLKEFYQLLSKN